MLYDEKDLRVFDNSDSRNYFKEILQSYYSQNYRATIVLLYSFVIYDLFIKLQTMADEGDSKARQQLEKVNGMISSDEKYSKVEREIIDFFKDNCSLYFERFIEDIEYLRNCRNKCAHLKVNDNSLYVPNDYHAKMMICSMYDHVLSVKAPFIMDLFEIAKHDVEKFTEQIIFDPDGLDKSIRKKITDKYLKRMTNISLKKSYKTFLKFLYNTDDEECIRNILGVYAFLFSMTSYLIEEGRIDLLREQAILDEFSKISVDELKNNSVRAEILVSMVLKYSIIMEIIRENEEVFEYLKARILIPTGLVAYRAFYPHDPRSEYGFFKDTSSLHKNKYIKEIFESVKLCEDFNLVEFAKIMVNAVPTYLGYDDADCYMSFLKIHVAEFNALDLQEIMDIYYKNDQCYNRGRHTADMEIIEPYLAEDKIPF